MERARRPRGPWRVPHPGAEESVERKRERKKNSPTYSGKQAESVFRMLHDAKTPDTRANGLRACLDIVSKHYTFPHSTRRRHEPKGRRPPPQRPQNLMAACHIDVHGVRASVSGETVRVRVGGIASLDGRSALQCVR